MSFEAIAILEGGGTDSALETLGPLVARVTRRVRLQLPLPAEERVALAALQHLIVRVRGHVPFVVLAVTEVAVTDVAFERLAEEVREDVGLEGGVAPELGPTDVALVGAFGGEEPDRAEAGRLVLPHVLAEAPPRRSGNMASQRAHPYDLLPDRECRAMCRRSERPEWNESSHTEQS